jgi:membrane-associated phospholipid phosphatase
MKNLVFITSLYLLCGVAIYSQDTDTQDTGGDAGEKHLVPLSTLFYHLGENALHSITFNYGANFAAAGLGTWGLIESGIDWKWRNFAYNHEPLANVSYSAVIYSGYVIPIATPPLFYLAGLFTQDEKLQIAGMALVQSMALASGFHVILKLSTGRSEPYVINHYHHERIDSSSDFSGKFNWFNMVLRDGWPSGHTITAFATAATISEIYSDITWLKIASYSYAVLTGIGVSLNVHWVSDVLAGALMGYVVGKTVGRSFNKLIKQEAQKVNVSFSITAQQIALTVKF